METLNKEQLINFEKELAKEFDNGELPYLIHFCGGNEDTLIKIFKDINEEDYVFSTHRNHYHYLLKGGSPEVLKEKIHNGDSMYIFDRKLNFYSSSIVCATPTIATGVALALKKKGSNKKVYCFIGDGAEDEGHFFEALKYVFINDLPCIFIIEDNNRSVVANKEQRWGNKKNILKYENMIYFSFEEKVIRYRYEPTYPHGGSGSSGWLQFKKEAIVKQYPEKIIKHLIPRETELSYKDAVIKGTQYFCECNKGIPIILGYNVGVKGGAYGTLDSIEDKYRLETPLAENLMAGLAMGLSIEGFKPILFFERHEFIFNALDALVNQLDKINFLSNGEFNMPMLIKIVSGSVKPFYAGLTHTSNLTNLFKELFTFPVYEPKTAGEVLSIYERAAHCDYPILISESKELY